MAIIRHMRNIWLTKYYCLYAILKTGDYISWGGKGMSKVKVLVLDDEAPIRGFVSINLKRNGFNVVEAATGEEAVAIMRERSDIKLALLDIMLPGIDGFKVCEELRRMRPQLGIIMLTAKGQEQDKVTGLEIGADDYVVKPFSPAELVARVKALLRRLPDGGGATTLPEITSGPFLLRMGDMKLYKDDEPILMTPTELAIVQLLMSKAGEAVSRSEILDTIWGANYVGDPKVVDVNIRRIRLKVEDDPSSPVYVETVWGYGYRWQGDAD